MKYWGEKEEEWKDKNIYKHKKKIIETKKVKLNVKYKTKRENKRGGDKSV